jgi:RNA polymerase sigma-54 factor
MIKQNLHLKLLHKLSPQQIQLMKLIQLPTQAFEQRLKQEIEENPALDFEKEAAEDYDSDSNEEDFDDSENDSIEMEDINLDEYLSDDEIPQYKLQSNNYSSDEDDNQIPYAGGVTFHQMLKSQLDTFTLSETRLSIAEFLVGSIDESGYIRREMMDIVDDLAFTQNIYTSEEEVLSVLKEVIQKMDPLGVGARDLKECLLLQLQHKKEKYSRTLAFEILKNSFDHFVKKHFKKLMLKLGIDEKAKPQTGRSFCWDQ